MKQNGRCVEARARRVKGRPRSRRREGSGMFRRLTSTVLFIPALVLAILVCSTGSAVAADPWWQVNSGEQPASLPKSGEGKIMLR